MKIQMSAEKNFNITFEFDENILLEGFSGSQRKLMERILRQDLERFGHSLAYQLLGVLLSGPLAGISLQIISAKLNEANEDQLRYLNLAESGIDPSEIAAEFRLKHMDDKENLNSEDNPFSGFIKGLDLDSLDET